MSAEERLEICKKCPLWEETEYGPKCCSRRYINKEGKVSWFPKEGYVKGCGCFLRHKTAKKDSRCVIGKW